MGKLRRTVSEPGTPGCPDHDNGFELSTFIRPEARGICRVNLTLLHPCHLDGLILSSLTPSVYSGDARRQWCGLRRLECFTNFMLYCLWLSDVNLPSRLRVQLADRSRVNDERSLKLVLNCKQSDATTACVFPTPRPGSLVGETQSILAQ